MTTLLRMSPRSMRRSLLPDLPDVLLHETAAAWVRNYFRKHRFSRAGTLAEQEVRLRQLLSDCAEHINANYDVEALCKSFPRRLRTLVKVCKREGTNTLNTLSTKAWEKTHVCTGTGACVSVCAHVQKRARVGERGGGRGDGQQHRIKKSSAGAVGVTFL